MIPLDRKILSFIETFSDCPAPEHEFNSLALELFRHQYERNIIYRRFCRVEDKTPFNIKSWKEIPAMPAVGFKEFTLAAFPTSKATRVFKTSGTTQERRGRHYFETLALYEASILPFFKKIFLSDKRKLQFYFLTHSPKERPDLSLSYMMGVVNRRWAGGRGKYYIKKEKADFMGLADDLIKQRTPAFILSTAFSLKAFLDFLAEEKIRIQLPKHSRLMETGGFKGRTRSISKRALYTACGRYLGISRKYCISEYGMTELSSQYYGQTTFRGPAWLRALVMDPQTGREAKPGQKGFLRHFDLANRGSVLAVQTEDIGQSAGNGFKLIGRSAGSGLRGCSLSYERFITPDRSK